MLIRWKRSLALSLGLLVAQARADDESWSTPPAPINPSAPAVSLGQPIRPGQAPAVAAASAPQPGVSLAQPIPLGSQACLAPGTILDRQFRPTAYSNVPDNSLTVRAASDDGGIQPATTTPGKSGSNNPQFSWSLADEVAPPPRPDPSNPPPPRVGDYFPGVAQVPAFGAGMPGPVMAPPVDGGPPSLSPAGVYPGNEFYIRAEGLLWWTKGSPVPALGTFYTGTPAPPVGPMGGTGGIPGAAGTAVVIGDQRFGTKNQGGGRLMAGYWFDDDHCWGIEAGGFVLGQINQSQTATSLGLTNLAIPYINSTTAVGNIFPIAGATGIAGLNDVGTMRLDYNTQFWGYEANLRGVWCRGPCGFIDGLVGFRGLGLDENLNFTAMTSGTQLPGNPAIVPGLSQRTISDHFDTQNRFYGGQVGLVMEYRSGCWVFDLTSKLALGVTRESVNINGGTLDMVAGNSTAIPTGFFAQQSNSGHFQQNQFAVVPELGATVGYQFTQRLRAFVGYNIIYWSRVARPGDQINPVINPASIPAFNGNAALGAAPTFAFHSSSFWAEGITFGIEWRY